MRKQDSSIQIFVSVELGSPAAECAHFGICSVSLLTPEQWSVFSPRHVRQVKAILSIHQHTWLLLEFPFSGMLPETYAGFFPPEGFRVDSVFPLPQPLTALSGLTTGLSILPGIYPLMRDEEGILLKCRVHGLVKELAFAA